MTPFEWIVAAYLLIAMYYTERVHEVVPDHNIYVVFLASLLWPLIVLGIL